MRPDSARAWLASTLSLIDQINETSRHRVRSLSTALRESEKLAWPSARCPRRSQDTP
ncbi:hypothetical protein XAPC_4335 [Xanthomonas citri pv. punicae str. LMG 859]|nr:hypothetical protein XAPC_4335 [Xanthomonas citri pv. punicae str. LMG 859]